MTLTVLENANGLGGIPNWSQLSPTGGPMSWRVAHSAVYDPATNRMIVFGGESPTGLVNDVWVLENANGQGGTPNWTQLSPTGGPPDPRGHHSAVYDPATNRMIVFGGLFPSFNDVWVLENANGLGGVPNWIQLSPDPDPVTGEQPIEREIHTGVYNPSTNRMIVFAGRTNVPSNENWNDVWVLTDATGLPPNQPSTADAGVDLSLECLDLTCAVILDGSGSTDPDSTPGTADDIVSYEWYEDYGTVDEVLLASGVSVSIDLPLGDHTITLLVEDTVGNQATDTLTVSVSLADLSLFEIEKAEVEWDKQKIKVHGKVGLPAGKSPFNVSPDGTVTITLSTPLGQVVNESVIFDVKGDEGKKWEYKDDSLSGVTKYKINWKGPKFDYNQDIRMKSNHIGEDSTELEIDPRGMKPLTIAVGGVTIDIDESGAVSVTPDTLEYDIDDDGEIEVELPFTFTPDITINISGAVSDTVIVGDYYTAAVGKFKIEASFNPSGYDGDLSPATLNLEVTLGDVGYPGSSQILEGDWKKLKTDEWKYKK